MERLRRLSLLLFAGWLAGCAAAPEQQAIPPPPDSADVAAEALEVTGITVTTPDGATYAYAPGETGLFEVGLELAFEADVVGAREVAWRWDFGDETGSTAARPTHRYSEPGAYTLVVQATRGAATAAASYGMEIRGRARDNGGPPMTSDPGPVSGPDPAPPPPPPPPPPAMPAVVWFEEGREQLSGGEAAAARRNGQWLAAQASARVWLHGYAAPGEERPYRLALRRVEAVRRAYVGAGVPAERIETWSMGPDPRCREGARCARVATELVSAAEWEASAPSFPAWPPPAPTAQGSLRIQDVLGDEGRTLGDAADRLRAALDRLGYARLGFYRLPGGFALATQIEQIEPDGRPKQAPDRFSLDIAPDRRRSFLDVLKGFFTPTPGYWRTVVFFVSALPIPAPEGELTAEEADALPAEGAPALPDPLADVPVVVPGQRSEFRCTVYVYEYHKRSADDPVAPRSDGPLSVRRHLDALGFYGALR